MREVVNLLKNFKESIGAKPVTDIAIREVHSGILLFAEKHFPQESPYDYNSTKIIEGYEKDRDVMAAAAKQKALIEQMIKDTEAATSLDFYERSEYNKLKEQNSHLDQERGLLLGYNKTYDEQVNVLKEQLKDAYKATDSLKELLKESSQSSAISNNEISKLLEKLKAESVQYLELKTQFEEAKQQISALNSEQSELRTQNEGLKVKKQVAEIAENSKRFWKQADANKKDARIWMFFVIASISALIALVFDGFKTSGDLYAIAADILKTAKLQNTDLINKLIYAEVAKKLGAKLFIYSTIIYLISFLVKNYNAQMHNYVTNAHKANALSSTLDLIGTAKSDDSNDKILVQATQAIFTTQRSGYQGADNEPKSPNLITNVIESMTGKKD
jgi:hypothetical protein